MGQRESLCPLSIVASIATHQLSIFIFIFFSCNRKFCTAAAGKSSGQVLGQLPVYYIVLSSVVSLGVTRTSHSMRLNALRPKQVGGGVPMGVKLRVQSELKSIPIWLSLCIHILLTSAHRLLPPPHLQKKKKSLTNLYRRYMSIP